MKTPGPDHPITVAPNPNRVVVTFGGSKIADTRRALKLTESTYPAVQYIPREDVDMTRLTRTARSTHCPYKGDAAYYSIQVDGLAAENAVWSYEAPYDSVAGIRNHLAFYPDLVAVDERPD